MVWQEASSLERLWWAHSWDHNMVKYRQGIREASHACSANVIPQSAGSAMVEMSWLACEFRMVWRWLLKVHRGPDRPRLHNAPVWWRSNTLHTPGCRLAAIVHKYPTNKYEFCGPAQNERDSRYPRCYFVRNYVVHGTPQCCSVSFLLRSRWHTLSHGWNDGSRSKF